MDSSLFVLATNDLISPVVSLGDSWLVRALASFTVTYWLHSTVLLGAAWLLLRGLQPDSHFIQERVWKIAAVAGFATAAVQLQTGLGVSVMPTSVVADSTSTLGARGDADLTLRKSNQYGEQSQRHLRTSLAMVQESLAQLGEGLPETLTESKTHPRDLVSGKTNSIFSTPNAVATDAVGDVTLLPDGDFDGAVAASDGMGQIVLPPLGVEPMLATDQRESKLIVEAKKSLFLGAAVGWFVAIWFLASLLYLGWQSVRFRWQMRHVGTASASHRKLLDSICESRGVTRSVRLLRSEQFVEPVAYGLLKWTILLPAQIEKRLNRDELTALLSHELAHLKRGDIFWLVVGRALTTCFAFQPLNFLAKRSWQEHAEFQCDDWAVDRNVDRLTLARSLTLVAEWRSGQPRCAGVVSAGGSRFHVSDRVERLVADAIPDRWRRKSRRFVVYLAATLLAGFLIVFGPQFGHSDRANAEATSASSDVVSRSEAISSEEQSEVDDSLESISELIREVEGLSGDVSVLLAELRTFEPLLAELERRPHLASHVSQIRTRIGLLRKLAAAKVKSDAVSTNESQNSHSQRQDAGTSTGEME
jgi:beta-lactamase regulating signal transducer with metallopeptidase domain